MLKILHLNNYISYTSGVTRYIYHIIKNTNHIFEHEIICLGGDAVELFSNQNVKVTALNYSGLFSLPGLYFFLSDYCKKNQFDIIHNHHRLFDTITAMIPRRNFKTIMTIHSKVYGWKWMSYKADKLISVSDCITNQLISYYNKPVAKIKRMKNFVDTSDIKIYINAFELRKQLNIQDNSVILFIGRFIKGKGTDILLKAFNYLYSLDNNIVLIMIGEGEEEKSLNDYSSENKLAVRLISPVVNIFDYYNIADVIVLPSRVDSFPYVMLEAGLMSKPFIGSNVDGISELIKHRINGLLFESENVSELIKCIQMILENQEFAEQISRNLNDDIVSHYTVEKVIHEYIDFYQSLGKAKGIS